MNMLTSFIKKANINRKLRVISHLFKEKETVLDFGCGDLQLTKALKDKKPFLTITGVDVVDLKRRSKGINFVLYAGEKLPFKDNSFDTVFSFYVFHHCLSAENSLRECLRVAKKRVLIVESIARHPIEIPFMKIVDWLYNIWKPHVELAPQFLTLKEWKEIFKKLNLKTVLHKKVEIMPQPSFLPLGRSYLFIFYKDKIYPGKLGKIYQSNQILKE